MPLEHEGIRQVDMDRVAQIARLRAVNAKLLAALEHVMDYLADPANPKPGLGAKNIFRDARAAIEEAKK